MQADPNIYSDEAFSRTSSGSGRAAGQLRRNVGRHGDRGDDPETSRCPASRATSTTGRRGDRCCPWLRGRSFSWRWGTHREEAVGEGAMGRPARDEWAQEVLL